MEVSVCGLASTEKPTNTFSIKLELEKNNVKLETPTLSKIFIQKRYRVRLKVKN